MLFQRDHATLKRVQGDLGIRHTFNKALAFTLAETLIVMGIIGVVAALTIPNLNSSTADKEKVAKVKKIYSNLNDALGRAQAVYGPSEEWTQLDTTAAAQITRYGERLTEFIKLSKTCGAEVSKGCFDSTKPKYLSGGTGNAGDSIDKSTYLYKAILADGASIGINSSTIVIDIDGPNKGSNQYGKDIFTFIFENNSVVPPAIDETVNFYIQDLNGQYSSAWVIRFDNMDYTKLSNGKCPNGKVPTDQSPTCK